MTTKGYIYFTEKNFRGGWVVYGQIGVHQFYGYSKKEAEERYKNECREKLFYEGARVR